MKKPSLNVPDTRVQMSSSPRSRKQPDTLSMGTSTARRPAASVCTANASSAALTLGVRVPAGTFALAAEELQLAVLQLRRKHARRKWVTLVQQRLQVLAAVDQFHSGESSIAVSPYCGMPRFRCSASTFHANTNPISAASASCGELYDLGSAPRALALQPRGRTL